MLITLKKILSNVNIFILALIISLYIVFTKISKNFKKYKNNSQKIKTYTVCFFISFIHVFIVFLFLGFSIKLFILPIKTIEYVLVIIFILLLIYFGFLFKRCFITILENKCLKLPQNFTWMGNVMNSDDYNITIKKGFVSKEFTDGSKGHLLIAIIISFKYLIELLVNSKYYK